MLDGTFKSLRSDHLNGTHKVPTTSLGVEEVNGDHGDISSETTTEESPIEKGMHIYTCSKLVGSSTYGSFFCSFSY